LLDDGNGPGGLYVEMVVDGRSFGIDQNGSGRPTGAVLAHHSRNFMGLWVAGAVGHGDIQTPFQLVFAQLFNQRPAF
jgi:hypothetical protein